MGTYSGYPSRKSIQDDLTRNGERRFAWVGNHLWFVVDAKDSSIDKPFIGLALVQRYSKDNWAYKPMDESMGPYYYDCPRSLLDAVPDPQFGCSTKWRESCKAHQERKRLRRR